MPGDDPADQSQPPGDLNPWLPTKVEPLNRFRSRES